MPDFEFKEVIIIAAVVTLTVAWIKLERQKGDPRLIAACGLLAYFLPIAGPLAALVILNIYDRRNRASRLPLRRTAKSRYSWARAGG